jgi:hypothetical protein
MLDSLCREPRPVPFLAGSCGDRIAAVYDRFRFPVTRFTDSTVQFLASVAGRRRVLRGWTKSRSAYAM